MKKKFFAVFFGLFFCLFVGSTSASAVESTTSSPTPLSESLPMLDEEFPIKRFNEFTIRGNESVEFFYPFKTPPRGFLGWKYAVKAKNDEKNLQGEHEWYVPNIDPNVGPKTGGFTRLRYGRNEERGATADQRETLLGTESWIRIKFFGGEGTYRMGLVLSERGVIFDDITYEDIDNYFDGQ